MKRVKFILFVLTGFILASSAIAERVEDHPGTLEYLKGLLYTPDEVDAWLAGKAFHFGDYDPKFGFLPGDREERHGLDNSLITYRYDPENYMRRWFNYKDEPCRINTYGDSFVNCEEVNDSETWQEVLAAHLCEPIRNFGTGNSIYWAYLRMRHEEEKTPGKFIIFNLYEVDHHRNMISWQRIAYGKQGTKSIHPTLPYLNVNPSTGLFEEHPNPCSSPELVHKLCDLDWVNETFRDDFYLQISVARNNLRLGKPERSYGPIQKLALEQGIRYVNIDTPEELRTVSQTLLDRAGMFATKETVKRVDEYAKKRGKEILYVLSYGGESMMSGAIEKGIRFDQELIDFLDQRGARYVDILQSHAEDFAKFKIPFSEYHNRYYVGHYSPAGNFFYAFSIKDKLVEMLDPKPVSYRD